MTLGDEADTSTQITGAATMAGFMNYDNGSTTISPHIPLVSDEFRMLFRAINFGVICLTLDIIGVITNTVNIIVFIKLGFNESINVSLLGLAISDFWSCLTLLWTTISLSPWFQKFDLPFDPNEMHYLAGGIPHVMFSRITGIITGYITFERCLCVMMPLRVKNIFTRRRTTIIIVCAYVIVMATFSPVYWTNTYEWIYRPHLNKSILGLVYSDDIEEVESVIIPIFNIAFPVSAFALVLICTILLVTTLKKKAKWRETATASSKTNEMSAKVKKVSTMVATIAIVFIVCFTLPVLLIAFSMIADKEFSSNGNERNLFDVMFIFSFTLASINSSTNIFIYYFKSTNYRNMFNQMFRRKGATSNKAENTDDKENR